MTEPVRLAKRVVALTQCSRREAEQYIEGGWVRVDGVVVEEPQFMVDTQTVNWIPAPN
jgi:23S rRNA pseudouridine2604 synthase